jgi:hypothetical protein
VFKLYLLYVLLHPDILGAVVLNALIQQGYLVLYLLNSFERSLQLRALIEILRELFVKGFHQVSALKE